MSDYDSAPDTMAHIQAVQNNIRAAIDNLAQRAAVHDASKLESPEKEMFDRMTPLLRALTYGSDEYKAALAEMGAALEHHYAHNDHHLEHYANGAAGMSLPAILEMLCDWRAAVMRHADGNLATSLEINRVRFGISDQLHAILVNTARELGWIS